MPRTPCTVLHQKSLVDLILSKYTKRSTRIGAASSRGAGSWADASRPDAVALEESWKVLAEVTKMDMKRVR